MRATCKRITAEKEKDMPSSQYNHLSISFLNYGSLSKRTDAKILIIIFKLLDGSLIVFLF